MTDKTRELIIQTCTSDIDEAFEGLRPLGDSAQWELVAAGFWSEDQYHSGFISYYLAKTATGIWVIDAVERNAVLDGVTEEDVEEGRLNDDQLQAIWGTTLEEAQNEVYQHIVAISRDAPASLSKTEIAQLMYDRICDDGGMRITEVEEDGLISP